MATLVGIVSVVVNVTVSFMSDGNWKTAGSGLAQFYWNYVKQGRQSPRTAARSPARRPSRTAWSATADAIG